MRISDWSSDVCSSDLLWYAVATADADGAWRRVLEGEGRLKSTGVAFKGWFVLTATSAGTTTRLHYNGVSYGPADAAAPIQNEGSGAKGGAYQIGRASCRARVCQYV